MRRSNSSLFSSLKKGDDDDDDSVQEIPLPREATLRTPVPCLKSVPATIFFKNKDL